MNLQETVIKGGYCVGCGVCAIKEGSAYENIMTIDLKYQSARKNVEINEESEEYAKEVCPFYNNGANETLLGAKLYNEVGTTNFNDKIGYYLDTYAGYVADGDYRKKGSSGGFGSWILSTLLKTGEVDGVIHVKESKTDNKLFEYTISRTSIDLQNGAKSKYYPIELSQILKKVKEDNGQYAIVGVPCFIKAVRLLMDKELIFKNNIKYCIGLVCGHLKSGHFASMLAWQVGIHPNELKGIDFRVKMDNKSANSYAVSAWDCKPLSQEVAKTKPMNTLFGGNWGHGFFKYKACDFCDDVLAELADITIGDAWLPQYVGDDQGTNIIIVRNPKLKTILEKSAEDNTIMLTKLSIDDIIKSQEGGFRHRREGLSYRLNEEQKKGAWIPIKRVIPQILIDKRTQKIQDLRVKLAAQSHVSFCKAVEENNFSRFTKEMMPLINEYTRLYRGSFLTRVRRKLNTIYKNIK